MEKTISTAVAAARLGTGRRNVIKLISKGVLKADRIGPGGWHRIHLPLPTQDSKRCDS